MEQYKYCTPEKKKRNITSPPPIRSKYQNRGNYDNYDLQHVKKILLFEEPITKVQINTKNLRRMF